MEKAKEESGSSIRLLCEALGPSALKITGNMIKAMKEFDIFRTFFNLLVIPVSGISQPAVSCILYTQETTWTLYFLTMGELRAEVVRPCCWKEQPSRKNTVYKGNYEFQLYKYTENKRFIHNQEDSFYTRLFWGKIAII